MIKASELRIGNLVDDGGRFYRVIKTSERSNYQADLKSCFLDSDKLKEEYEKFCSGTIEVDTIQDDDGYSFKQIHCFNVKGITLTPEILRECGFKKRDRLNVYDLTFDIPPITLENDRFYYKSSNIEVKYLHQLQNLYYALTGQELEIKNLQTTN